MHTVTRILFVDDDPNALAGFQRALKGSFEVAVAQGAHRALVMVANGPTYPVVVSDMRMPIMNGMQFLRRVGEMAPDTVRVLFTGQADLQTAIDAVNSGCIFQFLCKPCLAPQLLKTLQAAVARYELVCRERELLERTVRGSVQVVMDVLSRVNRPAYCRALRVAETVRHLSQKSPWPDAWKFEMAALLSHVGCIPKSTESLDAVHPPSPATGEGQQGLDSDPQVARDLIAQIPRLEDVAEMIARQRKPYTAAPGGRAKSSRDLATTGARMLRLAFDFDALLSAGLDEEDAVAHLAEENGHYDPALLRILDMVVAQRVRKRVVHVSIEELDLGMVLDKEVRTRSGLLLVNRGQSITAPLLQRLRNFSHVVAGEVSVRLPREDSARSARPESIS